MTKGGARLCVGLAAVIVAVVTVFSSAVAAGTPQLARIAYERNGLLFTIAADGSNRTQLTPGVRPHRLGYGDHTPDYSPDGERIAFMRALKVNRFGVRTKIEVMDADGAARHAVVSSGAHGYVLDPRWSPDGSHLAFARFTEGDNTFASSIVVMRNNGSHQRTIEHVRLGPGSRRLVYVWEPRWTPDGDRVIFTKTKIDHNAFFRPSLFSITTREKDKTLLLRNASSASFSPDGSQITFASTKDRNGSECPGDYCYYEGEIYVADADGTHQRRLTDTKVDEAEPDWSADGQRIVFSSHRESDNGDRPDQLFSITPTGACLVRLTHGPASSSAPAWEPDPALSSDPGGCL